MEFVQNSIAPLSPFSWVPEEELTRPGSANAVLHDIERLDMRFELIVDEFAIPFQHPVHRIYASHPLLRDTLTLQQLQLLQYGVVVDSEEQLVLVAAPPRCGDSGNCIADSYEQVFSRAMDTTSRVAHHPLLPEYTFVVYRLPAAAEGDHQTEGSQVPEPILRLVFRNVTPEQEIHDPQKVPAPRFKLVAVLTSSATYYAELQRGIQYRDEWRANAPTNRVHNPAALPASPTSSVNSPLPNSLVVPESVAREVRTASPLSKLCSSVARVLERFNVEDAGVDFNGAVSKNVVAGDAAESVTGSDDQRPCVVQAPDPWMYIYKNEGPRLRSRIEVVQRSTSLLFAWRDGKLDLAEYRVKRLEVPNEWGSSLEPQKSTHPLLSLELQRVPCVRLLLLPTHREVSTLFVENEVSSFLPKTEALDAPGTSPWGVVYASRAAERLRQWVLQGFVCAEVHGVRAVLLDLNPVDLLTPCLELLHEGSDAGSVMILEEDCNVDKARFTPQLRYRRALFLVCQIVLETVERYVRSSGFVWKVTVAVQELGNYTSASFPGGLMPATIPTTVAEVAFTNIPFTLWCHEILGVIQNSTLALELNTSLNTLSFTDDSDEKVGDGDASVEAASAKDAQAKALIVQPNRSKQLEVIPPKGVERAVAIYAGSLMRSVALGPQYIVAQTTAAGGRFDDHSMYLLFKKLCSVAGQKDALPVSALVDLLLEEWTGGSGVWRRYSPSRLMSPIDNCGVPVNRARVQRFLLPFLLVMRSAADVRVVTTELANKPSAIGMINYAQFSLVMLAILKM
ncbi:hypothetical protein JKF63_00868 [Porcisia hertigi]|uniref:Uncharacterized protein n=1 Tax=Porcisia hertigi TaxID=2761500 RepID=A0A836KXG3_9TRYP|nr:hypothetical protein JKF63_00868 [Porcisia hertigi]